MQDASLADVGRPCPLHAGENSNLEIGSGSAEADRVKSPCGELIRAIGEVSKTPAPGRDRILGVKPAGDRDVLPQIFHCSPVSCG